MQILSGECRTKHPTDKTPHVHFVIGGQKPPHVFLKADKTPHAQKYNVDKTPHADFKIRTKTPSCFCSVDKQMKADRSILMQTTCIFWFNITSFSFFQFYVDEWIFSLMPFQLSLIKKNACILIVFVHFLKS